jgi:DNA-binding XRE family transcriptional regulator
VPAFESLDPPDDLDRMVEDYTAANPAFPVLLDSAVRRRELLRELAAQRRERDLSQTEVAVAMATSQSTIARLEAGGSDPRLSTIDRFADAVGCRFEYRLVPRDGARA